MGKGEGREGGGGGGEEEGVARRTPLTRHRNTSSNERQLIGGLRILAEFKAFTSTVTLRSQRSILALDLGRELLPWGKALGGRGGGSSQAIVNALFQCRVFSPLFSLFYLHVPNFSPLYRQGGGAEQIRREAFGASGHQHRADSHK